MRAIKSFLIVSFLFLPTFLAAPAQTQSALPAPPAGSAATEPASNVPTLKVFSRQTIVDVIVTDSKGKRVHDLKQPDFILKEDRKRQTISVSEYAASAPSGQPPRTLPANVYTNLQPPPASNALNIVLLDGLNTAPVDAGSIDTSAIETAAIGEGSQLAPLAMSNPVLVSFKLQSRVKQETAKYFQSMPTGTRVAVLGLTTGLRVLQGFTSNPSLLSAAANTMEIYLDGRASTPEAWCTQQETRNRLTLAALNQVAADLAQIDGRKNLLWFGIGSPTLTDPSLRPSCLPDHAPELRKLYDLLGQEQISIYMIDSRGQLPIAPNTGVGKIISNADLLNPSDSQEYAARMADELSSLESVAKETGGAAFYNTDNLAGSTAKAIDDGSEYYALSYVPPSTRYDGRYHHINVTVNRKHLQLVYREGYSAEDPANLKPPAGFILATAPPEASAANMQVAMGRSIPISNQILFDTQVEPSTVPAKPGDPPVAGELDAKLRNKPLTRYSFQSALPGREIVFANGPNNTRHASLEFDLAAYDAKGNVVTSLRKAVQLNLTPEQVQELAKSPFRYEEQLDLPSGQLFFRVGVLDRTSNKTGTLEIPLTVPKK